MAASSIAAWIYIYVCVCVFISFHCKAFPLLNKTISIMPEFRKFKGNFVTMSKTIIAGTFNYYLFIYR